MLGITTTAETGEKRKEEEMVIGKNMRTEGKKREKKSYTWTYKYGENKKKTDPKQNKKGRGGGGLRVCDR